MRVNIFKSLIVLICMVFGINGTNNIYDCKTGNPKPPDFCFIEDCPRAPCLVHKDRSYAMEVNFLLDKEYKQVFSKATVQLFDMDFPYPGYDSVNCCDNIYYKNSTPAGCPLHAGEEYTYKNDIKVYDFLPEIMTSAKVRLVDEKENEVLCAIYSFQITK